MFAFNKKISIVEEGRNLKTPSEDKNTIDAMLNFNRHISKVHEKIESNDDESNKEKPQSKPNNEIEAMFNFNKNISQGDDQQKKRLSSLLTTIIFML